MLERRGAWTVALLIVAPLITGDGDLVFLDPVSSTGEAPVGLDFGLLLLRRSMRRTVSGRFRR